MVGAMDVRCGILDRGAAPAPGHPHPLPPPPHGGPGSRGGAPPPGTAHIAIKNIGAMKAAKGITPVSVGSRPQAPLRAPHGCRSFPCFFFNLSRIRIGSVCEV